MAVVAAAAASLSCDLAQLFTGKGVNAGIQAKFSMIRVTNMRLFALLAESRAELRLLLKEPPFDLDPAAENAAAPDQIEMRVSIAQITDAWMFASACVVAACLAAAVAPAPSQDGFGKASTASSSERPAPYEAASALSRTRSRTSLEGSGKGGKDKDKAKGGGKFKGKGCHLHSRTKVGTPICFRYNTAGKKCKVGCGKVHCCQKCLKMHPVYECEKAE